MQNLYKKRILFVGMPDMALVCLQKLHSAGINIVGVVPPSKKNNTYSFFVQYAQSLGLNVISYEHKLDDEDFIENIKALNVDLAVVCSYNKLFPKAFLKTAKDGFINTHPSLLPKYRGANPYSHSIIEGEKETGVTFHYMDETFDTGDIVAQYKAVIEPFETMGTLFNKLNFLSADALVQVLKFYEDNSTLPRVPQAKGEYKYAYPIDLKYGNCFIDWGKPAKYIERYIRALNPFISAGTKFRGTYVKIHSADWQNKIVKQPVGTIVGLKNAISVATSDGILQIKILQVGSYLIGDAKDFVTVFNPKIGEKFE